jgi:uncharacterized protein YjbI with pentapeptide repeats
VRAFGQFVVVPLAAMWLLSATAGATLVAGQDARGTNHFDHDHANQTLTAVDLSPDPVSLAPSNLAQATFSNSILDQADLTGVIGGCLDPITRVDCTTFDGARLFGAILIDAQLASSSFDFAEGAGVAFTGADLQDASFLFADLTDSNWTGADLSGLDAAHANLATGDLTGADATGANFDSAELQDIVWVDGILHDADFAFADLSGIDARCSDSIGAMPGDPPPAIGTCTEFDGATFRHANLRDGSFQYGLFVASVTGVVDLSDAVLTRADFSDACFTESTGGVCYADLAPPVAAADLSGAGWTL